MLLHGRQQEMGLVCFPLTRINYYACLKDSFQFCWIGLTFIQSGVGW